MGDDQGRRIGATNNGVEMFEHLAGRLRVQIARWLVRQQDSRRIGHGAGNGDTLLFTA